MEIENFFWNDFCDNYLEIVKKRVYQGTGNKKVSAQYTLYYSLLKILKLLAPIMPFVTEEIYQTYYKKTQKEKSIHISTWPRINTLQIHEAEIDKKEGDQLALFYETLSKIRQEKSSSQKAMNSEIILTLDKKTYDELSGMLEDLQNVTNAIEIKSGKFKIEFL